ncbi:MAG: hypothetical protein AAF989_09670 [Planctomycetota bacterium]
MTGMGLDEACYHTKLNKLSHFLGFVAGEMVAPPRQIAVAGDGANSELASLSETSLGDQSPFLRGVRRRVACRRDVVTTYSVDSRFPRTRHVRHLCGRFFQFSNDFMALTNIPIPESIKRLPLSDNACSLIDHANDRLEEFMLSDQEVIENFVTCDFHLCEQALQWIEDEHLLAGNRFCELGSGFGVAALLAASRSMEAYGIEIEPVLVEQATQLADDLDVDAQFFSGSFVPRNMAGLSDLSTDVHNVCTDEGDVFDEIGLSMDDFDLFFAFPWPGEHTFFESVIDSCAADGCLLLTYRGREGMHLMRRVS